MRRFIWWAAITIAALLFLAGSLLLASAAWLTEGALHPARPQTTRSCPSLPSIQCTEVAISSPDEVALRAWYLQPEHPNGRSVIVLHGIGASRADMIGVSGIFLNDGYSVLAPDLRGHGTSGGFTTYGVREEGDIHAWADWLFSVRHTQRLYGFGASLGGSVLIESLRKEQRFRAVVAESAFADFRDIAVERMDRQVPAVLAAPLVECSLLYARVRDGVDLRQASPIQVLRTARTPVLLIHGAADRLTAPVSSQRMAAANPAFAQLWMVPGGGHANIWSTAGHQFEARVIGFFDTH